MKLPTKLLLVASTALLAATASARDDGTVDYRVAKGDTLYQLAQDYFSDRSGFVRVQRINRIRNPRELQPNRLIKIPRDLLRYEPVDVRVIAFNGPVTIAGAGEEGLPTLGMVLREGAVVSTGMKGFVSLAGHENSRISLPSNSRVRIDGARRYLIDNSVDFDLKVLEGRGEVVAPKLKSNERYRVGTPVAATAVRGTQFRVSFDPTAEIAATEVTEGTVTVANDVTDIAAEAGFGVSARAGAMGELEALLPSPELINAGRVQTADTVAFAIVPLDGAKAYRTQLARDAGFIEVVSETIEPDTQPNFDELDDGRYFVRSRGIAQSGLEGFSEAYSFRRKRVGVQASVANDPNADAFKFAWLPEGSGKSFHAFQLWREGQEGSLLFDEVGLEQFDLLISELDPGSYQWRVGAFQIDEGDVIKVWGEAQTLNITE
ncbi:FecR domain-containing protein [Altererythrobacter arenosus]|uniref:FecR domain-containing protein n=1 Tax=Altererythrobacter arenosus TaxID=3032592 RepID=A0ABY8FPX8_9SPHN|nr:FecR domain-containing protein [Altererythrobacter sp. CAU 1644]WFL77069.1 FecR domain-containing protein [Altererythrobacter sp. CAU 1644]